MLFLKYFFFRIYMFYNARWPDKDPDTYAFSLTALFTLLLILGIILNLNNILNIPIININSKYKLLYLLGGIVACLPIYNYLITNDRYKSFCNINYYKNTIFQSTGFGTFFCWGYAMLPVILIIISAIMQKR
ncbi:hypothetical protein A8C56_02060 [Niabella ginsenosidivorans]|uniref:Uncharacterized protein n=1 Tax=Niabella ginsenosidivorans TaxID=1176587 RepID=A0A1A9HZM3_9BACT|nr:hypothetical protein A8C56_02060 [Niabella ginsenosidivorans]